MLRKFRKPLVIFSPKSLLRHKEAVSNIIDFTEKTEFKEIIIDKISLGEKEKIKKVIFCSGKIYYDLKEKLDINSNHEIQVIRIEQLYPFPYDLGDYLLAKCHYY